MLDFIFGGPVDWRAAFNPPSRFPKWHIREYDPDGIYTYKDQNPRFSHVETAVADESALE